MPIEQRQAGSGVPAADQVVPAVRGGAQRDLVTCHDLGGRAEQVGVEARAIAADREPVAPARHRLPRRRQPRAEIAGSLRTEIPALPQPSRISATASAGVNQIIAVNPASPTAANVRLAITR